MNNFISEATFEDGISLCITVINYLKEKNFEINKDLEDNI